jgi:hypothetical protein
MTQKRSKIEWFVIYSVGYWAGGMFHSAGHWIQTVIISLVCMYAIEFALWVLRGYKITKQLKEVEKGNFDKFGWHNKK